MQEGDGPFSILRGVTIRKWTVLYTGQYLLPLVCGVLQNLPRMIWLAYWKKTIKVDQGKRGE